MAGDQVGRGGLQGGGRDDGGQKNQGETAPTESCFGRKGALTSAVDEESGCQIRAPDQQNPNGGGSGDAEEDPAEPADGQEHRQSQEILEGVHPCAGFGQEGKKSREKGEKQDGKGEAESESGEDGEGADGGQSKGSREGDPHEGGGARGSHGDG